MKFGFICGLVVFRWAHNGKQNKEVETKWKVGWEKKHNNVSYDWVNMLNIWVGTKGQIAIGSSLFRVVGLDNLHWKLETPDKIYIYTKAATNIRAV